MRVGQQGGFNGGQSGTSVPMDPKDVYGTPDEEILQTGGWLLEH